MKEFQETRLRYYAVTLNGQPATVLGGPLRDAGNGCVWLTRPDGTALFQLPRDWVVVLTREQAAARIAADRAGRPLPFQP